MKPASSKGKRVAALSYVRFPPLCDIWSMSAFHQLRTFKRRSVMALNRRKGLSYTSPAGQGRRVLSYRCIIVRAPARVRVRIGCDLCDFSRPQVRAGGSAG